MEDLIAEQAKQKMPLAVRIVLAVLLSMYNIPVIVLLVIKSYHEGFLSMFSIILFTSTLYISTILYLIAPVKMSEWEYSFYKFTSSFRQDYAAPNSLNPFRIKFEKIFIFVSDLY